MLGVTILVLILAAYRIRHMEIRYGIRLEHALIRDSPTKVLVDRRKVAVLSTN